MQVKDVRELFFWMTSEGYVLAPRPITPSEKEGYKIVQRVGNQCYAVGINEMIRRFRNSKIKTNE